MHDAVAVALEGVAIGMRVLPIAATAAGFLGR
jgi:hypothetical protein